MSSRLRWSKKVSVEHMRRIRRKRLNGMAPFGLLDDRMFLGSIDVCLWALYLVGCGC